MSIGMEELEAVDKAVAACIEANVLRDFLTEHREEVRHVCMTEFDEDKFIETLKAEGREEGKQNTLINLVKSGLLSIKDACAVANMTEKEFASLVSKA